MPVFEYRALDAGGQSVTGTLVSQSLAGALENLSQQGLHVEHVGVAQSIGDPLARMSVPVVAPQARPENTEERQEVSVASEGPNPHHYSVVDPIREQQLTSQRSYWKTNLLGPLVNKIPLSQLQFFFRQLATMQKAGVGLVQSLDTLTQQAGDPRFKKILAELGEHVRAGRPISAGMVRYPEVFSPIMISLTRAGEEGGMVESSLAHIANYIEEEIKLRNLLRRLTIYPKLLLVGSIVVIVGANAIISTMAPGAPGLSSPLTTATTWYFLVPLMIAVFLFLRMGLQNEVIKHKYDMFIAHIPFMGTVVRQFAMAKFGRAFGTLYRGGIPMHRGIELAADACGNQFIRSRIYPVVQGLKEGAGITDSLRATGVFSPIVLNMTQTGETTGSLDQMLENVSDFYEDEATVKANQLANIFAVVVLLGVAIYIGYIVISFWMNHYGPQVEQLRSE